MNRNLTFEDLTIYQSNKFSNQHGTMFGKLKKKASRISSKKFKFSICIYCSELQLPPNHSISVNTVLNIIFEKDGKASVSNDIVYDGLCPDKILLDEKVELILTFYKDSSTNKFQVKLGKVSLKFGGNSSTIIGTYLFNLHQLVQSMGYEKYISKEYSMVLEQSSSNISIRGVTLLCDVKVKLIHDGDKDDPLEETNSVHSFVTDSSYAAIQQPSSSLALKSVFDAKCVESNGKEEDDDFTLEKSSNEITHSAAITNAKKTGWKNRLFFQNNGGADNDVNKVDDDDGASNTKLNDAAVSSRRDDSGKNEEELSSGNSERARKSSEAFQLYSKELRNRALRIKELEDMYSQSTERYQTQISTLRSELNQTELALKKERTARNVIAEVTQKGDELLASALAEARTQSASLSACLESTQAELKWANEELTNYKTIVNQMFQERDGQLAMSHEAAALLSKSNIEVTELEDENDVLLKDLINVKVRTTTSLANVTKIFNIFFM